MHVKKNICLIAHDNKKHELLKWVSYNKETLKNHDLIATGTTGSLIQQETHLKVEKLLSGPLGGDQQVGALIATGKIDVLIFFWDPLGAMAHDPDVKALLRIAVTWNIPFANNISSADFLISSELFNSDYQRELPNFKNYLNRLRPKF